MKAGILKWIASTLVGVWVSVPLAIQLLVILCCVDFVTSLFNSRTLLRDQIKRMTLSIILALSLHMVYSMAADKMHLNLGFDIVSIVCTFYMLSEVVYILQNCSRAGLALPPKLLDLLSKAGGMTHQEVQEINSLARMQDRRREDIQDAKDAR